jgi:hypothetical protein
MMAPPSFGGRSGGDVSACSLVRFATWKQVENGKNLCASMGLLLALK